MIIYTTMPLELVMDGFQHEPGPFIELVHEGLTMQVQPTAPGVGTIVRLLHAPLERYLNPEYTPGRTIYFAAEPANISDTDQAGLGL
jgi:hypothetical protein